MPHCPWVRPASTAGVPRSGSKLLLTVNTTVLSALLS
jgi:hypothetical protein